MKRILVTGLHGYIGQSFCTYLKQFPQDYLAEPISLRGTDWKSADFSPYDVVVHAAGLAHQKETAENAPQYDAVNRALTVELAQLAKEAGVRQFVFLSSMSVYGMDEGVITPDTVPHPKSYYGKSKLEAEQQLLAMQSETFHVCILRPPMVYGDGCKGNYQMLVKLAKLLPVCPDYRNQRSMISIDRLCWELKARIDRDSSGIFCPQNPDYICTCQMIQQIAAAQGKRLPLTRALNFGPILLRRFTAKGRKAFGNLVYAKQETLHGSL